MKVLILVCILVGLLVHSSAGTNCICKCCSTDGCDASKATSKSFDLSGVCNPVTCNRATCSTQFKSCPIPTSAGNVDSTCGNTSMAPAIAQMSIVTLSAVLIATLMKWNSY